MNNPMKITIAAIAIFTGLLHFFIGRNMKGHLVFYLAI